MTRACRRSPTSAPMPKASQSECCLRTRASPTTIEWSPSKSGPRSSRRFHPVKYQSGRSRKETKSSIIRMPSCACLVANMAFILMITWMKLSMSTGHWKLMPTSGTRRRTFCGSKAKLIRQRLPRVPQSSKPSTRRLKHTCPMQTRALSPLTD